MKVSSIVLAVSIVILLGGAVSAYCFDDGTEMGIVIDSDGRAVMKIDGSMPAEATYRIMSGTHVPDRIYIYLDEDYTGGLVSYNTQEMFYDAVRSMLSDRGYDSVESIDAIGLAGIIDDPAIASSSGILFLSGAIPETVYPDDSSNMMLTWFGNGGTVYWSGPDIGMYRGLSDGSNEPAEGFIFGGDMNCSEEEEVYVRTHSEISSEMGFTNYRADYGLRADYDGTPSRILGLYDEYSSLSVVSIGSGRVYIQGHYLTDIEVENLASYLDMIVSGITENTVIEETGSFHKGRGQASFTSEASLDHGDIVYLSIGEPVSKKAVCFKM